MSAKRATCIPVERNAHSKSLQTLHTPIGYNSFAAAALGAEKSQRLPLRSVNKRGSKRTYRHLAELRYYYRGAVWCAKEGCALWQIYMEHIAKKTA